jgi:hypothetical protein
MAAAKIAKMKRLVLTDSIMARAGFGVRDKTE